jgi:hypothetical protein
MKNMDFECGIFCEERTFWCNSREALLHSLPAAYRSEQLSIV